MRHPNEQNTRPDVYIPLCLSRPPLHRLGSSGGGGETGWVKPVPYVGPAPRSYHSARVQYIYIWPHLDEGDEKGGSPSLYIYAQARPQHRYTAHYILHTVCVYSGFDNCIVARCHMSQVSPTDALTDEQQEAELQVHPVVERTPPAQQYARLSCTLDTYDTCSVTAREVQKLIRTDEFRRFYDANRVRLSAMDDASQASRTAVVSAATVVLSVLVMALLPFASSAHSPANATLLEILNAPGRLHRFLSEIPLSELPTTGIVEIIPVVAFFLYLIFIGYSDGPNAVRLNFMATCALVVGLVSLGVVGNGIGFFTLIGILFVKAYLV